MMKNDEIHSKAMELEHVKFEKERLQADLEKMEKVTNGVCVGDRVVTSSVRDLFVRYGFQSLNIFFIPSQMHFLSKLLKEKQKKTKAFYLRSQESQKKLEERLSQEEVSIFLDRGVGSPLRQSLARFGDRYVHLLWHIYFTKGYGGCFKRRSNKKGI